MIEERKVIQLLSHYLIQAFNTAQHTVNSNVSDKSRYLFEHFSPSDFLSYSYIFFLFRDALYLFLFLYYSVSYCGRRCHFLAIIIFALVIMSPHNGWSLVNRDKVFSFSCCCIRPCFTFRFVS